jgi:hypothetical protein
MKQLNNILTVYLAVYCYALAHARTTPQKTLAHFYNAGRTKYFRWYDKEQEKVWKMPKSKVR